MGRARPPSGLAGCGRRCVARRRAPGAIPYDVYANLGALSDTLALIPLWNLVFFGHIQAVTLPALVIVCSLAAAGLFLLVPRRLALLPVALVLGWFVLLQVPVERQMKATSEGVLQQGLGGRREWIDEKVGGNARVAALWTGNGNPMTMLQNAFFNRSVHPVFDLDGAAPVAGLLPQQSASIDPASGDVRAADGASVQAGYALADPEVEVSRTGSGARPAYGARSLPRARRPGPYTRPRCRRLPGLMDRAPRRATPCGRCRGGRLTLGVASQKDLFTAPQTVLALSGKRTVGRLRIRPGEEKSLTVPMGRRTGTARSRCGSLRPLSPPRCSARPTPVPWASA